MNTTWQRGTKVTKDSNSFKERKEKKEKKDKKQEERIRKEYYKNRNEPDIIVKKEFNLYDHPEMCGETFNITPTESTFNYLDKCKIQKKEDIKSKNTLPLGWIAFKGEKGSSEIKVSRNNILNSIKFNC